MKRYTKSVNIRFEPYIEEQLDNIVKKDFKCVKENWSKSDVVRHFVRVGVKNWEKQMRNY